MAPAVNATLLQSLDAVVLDTETTGLDAKTARLLQLGAIRITGADLDSGARLERLVNPGVPVPPATTAIHGITDDAVRGAPRFAEIASDLSRFLDSSIVIGHTVSFDLAILQREYDLAGLPWRPPRALDIRHLARIAAPGLAQYDLDGLCAWLDIAVVGRHTAMGDAMVTAQVFAALLPMLRQANVRTLAEAEQAVRRILEREAGLTGGFTLLGAPGGQDETRVLARIDSFPYRHRVRDVMSPPVAMTHQTSIAEASRSMIERKISSVFVEGPAGEPGIVTERDVLRAIAASGAAAVQLSLADVMTVPLQTIAEDAFLYRALGRMDRLNFRHLGVRNAAGEIVGALTSRGLLRQRASAAIVLGDQTEQAGTVTELGRVWPQLPALVRSLLSEQLDARTVAAVISSEICALTRKAAGMAEMRMRDEGFGPPPLPYCVLVLGSAGRGESLLAADQDNAIVYRGGTSNGAEDRWFRRAGGYMAEILDAVGIPTCKGGVMASEAAWCQSLEAWKRTVDGWLLHQRPEDLLNVDIFFDGLPVAGALPLGHEIRDYAYDAAGRTPDFLKMLTVAARDWAPARNFFGGIRSDGDGRVDLKKGALMPILMAARVLSIRHQVPQHSTAERFEGVKAKGIGSPEEIESIVDEYDVILRMILMQQLSDIESGIPPSSRVDLKKLKKQDRRRLSRALDAADAAARLVNEGLF